MHARFGKVLRFAAFGSLSVVLCLAISEAFDRVAADSHPVALGLLKIGGSSLVMLGAYSASRAPARTRRFVLPAALLTALSVTTLLWLHLIHGALAAVWAAATRAHSGTTVTASIPPRATCINGHAVKNLPLVWDCFGHIGSRPDEYYRGYFGAVYFLYESLPAGTDCETPGPFTSIAR